MNFKALIAILGFAPKENVSDIYSKKYTGGYSIEVDFDRKEIHFGDKIQSENRTTSNFSQPENFVVLECVNRLLEKGYRPENIILEKTWPSGHGTSGRLDICVTRDDGSEYLLIECKTFGKEYDNAVKKLHKDGGQLFTYFKFSNKADVIMLYASEFKGKEIVYKNEIVKIEDDYRTGDVRDFYEKWNKLTKDNGVFDSWVVPYNFESKALTPKQLKAIKQDDSSFIFNRFLEILRHNVVSDKPNAFNKIFTLFLCKVYDEKTTKPNEELKFQWLEGKDDDISFQIRLTDLYKAGMKEFLEKEVTDFSEDDFDKEYRGLSDEVKVSLKRKINKLRLEKNNEFAIKEVYDEKSFNENAKIVKEVVELLQGYRIRYNKRQQYLSDFFELLLTTGLKQESGQFFTPVPIAQFIIKSLPIDQMVDEKLEKGERNNLLPYIIDYAAGSGHFLTESMHEVQRMIDAKNPEEYIADTRKKINNWQGDHFDWATQYVYGIEKDYRLVKVGKVGCYLHGDGLANVILSDGLANFTHTSEYKGLLKHADTEFPKENKQFDVLISNPPYSVSAFKIPARDYYTEKDFELYEKLTDNSSEIECLFVERTKQLLKDGGVAGVILPSSILSNSGIYAKAREIILKHFEVIAIAELGGNTFMATNTNTVTLFLRRRNNYDSINIKKSVEKVFDTHKDVTINGIEKPVLKYVDYVWEGLDFDDYVSILKQSPTKNSEEHDIYKEYRKKLKSKNEADFWRQLLEVEAEKLLYFILAYPQKVVVIKSGQKDAEKRFLGYEFSNRRGSEGIHPIQRGKSIAECTQLFDEDSFENPEKASTFIYKAFKGDFDFGIPESLQNNISRHNLVDMLTFDRVEFENNISTSVKKKVKIESRWEIKKLSNIVDVSYGTRIVRKLEQGTIYPVYGGGGKTFKANSYNRKNCYVISRFGMSPECVRFIGGEFFLNDSGLTVNSKNLQILSQEFLDYFLFLNQEFIYLCGKGVAQKNLDMEDFSVLPIPLPPLDIQQKIVSEIQILEQKEKEAKEGIERLKGAISSNFETNHYPIQNLGDIADFKNGLNYSRSSLGEIIDIVGVKDFQDNFSPNLDLIEKVQIEGGLSEDYKLKPNDILVVRSNGSANLVGRFLFIPQTPSDKTSFSGFTIRIRPSIDGIEPKFLCHYLKTDIVRNELTGNSRGSNIKSLNQTMLGALRIPLPPISEQQRIVSEIEEIESQIKNLENEIARIPAQKEEILKKYL